MPKKKPETDKRERACIAAVWRRDQGRSRASALPVVKGHDDERQRGEVAHLRKRSTHPIHRWDPDNCVLLTGEEHRVSDARTAPGGKVLLRINGTNAKKALTFTRVNEAGQVLWTRRSLPPPKPAGGRPLLGTSSRPDSGSRMGGPPSGVTEGT